MIYVRGKNIVILKKKKIFSTIPVIESGKYRRKTLELLVHNVFYFK